MLRLQLQIYQHQSWLSVRDYQHRQPFHHLLGHQFDLLTSSLSSLPLRRWHLRSCHTVVPFPCLQELLSNVGRVQRLLKQIKVRSLAEIICCLLIAVNLQYSPLEKKDSGKSMSVTSPGKAGSEVGSAAGAELVLVMTQPGPLQPLATWTSFSLPSMSQSLLRQPLSSFSLASSTTVRHARPPPLSMLSLEPSSAELKRVEAEAVGLTAAVTSLSSLSFGLAFL